jgi:hypothetical protein
MAQEWDEETLAFAHRMFDLARVGRTAELIGYVDAGLPIDMTNESGTGQPVRGRDGDLLRPARDAGPVTAAGPGLSVQVGPEHAGRA